MDVWLGNWGSGCVVEWAGRGQKVVGVHINKYMDMYSTHMGMYISKYMVCI